MKEIRESWKGIFLCLAIAIPAWYIGTLIPVIGGPVIAILLGMLAALFINDQKDLKPGINFTAKKILQLAVVLLGFGMNLAEILHHGFQSLPIIICTITVSLVIAFLLQKVLKTAPGVSILIGVGSSICGGSAIAATAPVIAADDEEVAQAISVIFLFNVIAAVLFPTLGAMLHLSNAGFGLFAGTAINDTSSVTAATTVWDSIYHSNTLEIATIVKLTRTLAIIPITITLAVVRSRKELKAGTQSAGQSLSIKKIFPYFILYFVLASVITTVFDLPDPAVTFLKTASKFFIVMAMAAIGLNTNIIKLIKTGGKSILMGFCCWIGIIGTCLMLQQILHLW